MQHRNFGNSKQNVIAPAKETQVTTRYGHNGSDKVMMAFSRPISDMYMTEEQCMATIHLLGESLQALRDHRAGIPTKVPGTIVAANPGSTQ